MSKIDILIIEDDPATQKALPILLNAYGFKTYLANTLEDALDKIKEEPKFLLLDLMLPDGNGIEVLKYIKNNDLKTKVIITTSYLDQETKSLGYPVLMKPIDFETLLDFLKS